MVFARGRVSFVLEFARKKVPDTNGGSLRNGSTGSKQPIFDFGPKMQFLCVNWVSSGLRNRHSFLTP